MKESLKTRSHWLQTTVLQGKPTRSTSEIKDASVAPQPGQESCDPVYAFVSSLASLLFRKLLSGFLFENL